MDSAEGCVRTGYKVVTSWVSSLFSCSLTQVYDSHFSIIFEVPLKHSSMSKVRQS